MRIDWAPVLNVVNRHSARALGLEAVLFCSVGGVFLGYAAAEVLFYGPPIRAFGFFVLGMASLAWGIFWVRTLMGRIHSVQPSSG
jgi:hypothetical protein